MPSSTDAGPVAGTLGPGAYLSTIRAASDRVRSVLSPLALTTPVPTCSGWDAGDLLRHLAEVQAFWAAVVGDHLDGEHVPEPERPADADLLAVSAASSAALLAALVSRAPEEECWTWFEPGQNVGWVARRQAHEALIHRVDAELAARRDVTPAAAPLAADGVDEMLRVMLDAGSGPGVFVADGASMSLVSAPSGQAWAFALGRWTPPGAEPGVSFDALAMLDHEPGAHRDAVVTGSAWDLDRWLWGRGDVSALRVEGDAALAERLRAMVVDATQ